VKTKYYQIVLALLLSIASSGTAFAALVNFEGLGLNSGDAVPSIGIASFTASAAVQGDMYAFVSYAGNDTAYSPPFSNAGNTFITNPGGYSSTTTKTIEIFFSLPVYGLSFYAADIDSGGDPYVEQLTATVFDSANNQLKQIIYQPPSHLNGTGDGNVIRSDFAETSGITRVTISLSSIGSTSLYGIGFGVDNLEFQIAPQPVPLPPSSLLFGTGLIGCFGYIRWKLKRN
jgi:hypothetical protein